MSKQRRNREKATELITVLDDIVPAKYPYRYAANEGVLSQAISLIAINRLESQGFLICCYRL
jgi:hypothetical protein